MYKATIMYKDGTARTIQYNDAIRHETYVIFTRRGVPGGTIVPYFNVAWIEYED